VRGWSSPQSSSSADAPHRTGPDRTGPDDDAALPGWIDGIAGFGPGRSLALGAGIGVGVGVGNPKNIAVAVGTAVAVSSAGLPVGEQAVVLATYVVPGSLGVGAPIVTMLVLGDRAAEVLDGSYRSAGPLSSLDTRVSTSDQAKPTDSATMRRVPGSTRTRNG
jgi:hypothetical protein